MKSRLLQNISLSLFVFIAFCKGQMIAQEIAFVSCGHAELDSVRRTVKIQPTTFETVEERRAAITRLWRLLWRQGTDMSSFDTVANDLLILADSDALVTKTLDKGFEILEQIIANPSKIPEVRGKRCSKISSVTNWPGYHGVDGKQNGFSPDKGPETGKVSWKFPKSNGWNAGALLKDGKVYVAGAGTDVVAFCLDQKTGEVLWKGRTNSSAYYHHPGAKQTPQIEGNQLIVRTATTFHSYHVETGEKTYTRKYNIKNEGAIASAYIINAFFNQIISCNDAATGKQNWQYFSNSKLTGAPVVTENAVYLTNTNNTCIKLDRKKGNVVWKKTFDQTIRGNTSFAEDKVLIAFQSGQLCALDRITGVQVWHFSPNRKEPRAYDFYGKATVQDGKIYIGAADNYFYCIDARNGKKLWDFKVDDWLRSKPVIIGNTIYFGDLSGMGYGLTISKRKPRLLWKAKISDHGFTADLSGNEEGVLFSDRNMLLTSVNLKNGKSQWKHSQLDGAWIDGAFYAAGEVSGQQASPTIVDGVLYITSPDGFLNAVSVHTGKELWKFETKSSSSTTPTVAEGKVFVGQTYDSYGQYFALDKASGLPVWTSNKLGSVWVNAVYGNGKLFLGNMQGDFFAIDPNTGNKLWNYYTAKDTPNESKPLTGGGGHGWPPGVYCNPALEGNVVYTGSWAGYYFAFEADSGNLLWRCKTQPDGMDGGLPDSAAPVLHKEHLYVQKAGAYIAAIHKKTGKIDWQWIVQPGWLQNGTIAALDDMIFGSSIRGMGALPYNSTIHAFKDIENGSELLWEYNGGGGLTTPVLTKDKLIFGSSANPFLTCLNPKTGKVIWRTHVGGIQLESVPSIYGDKVFALIKNGYLYAIE